MLIGVSANFFSSRKSKKKSSLERFGKKYRHEVEVEEDDPFLMESFSCLTSLEYPYH